MLLRTVVLLSLCFVVRSEPVFRRYCEGVGSSTCQVTSVEVDNCSHAPRFCRVANGKRYPVTVNFVPNFTADKMILSTAVDRLDGTFGDLKTTKRVCEDHKLICPLEPQIGQKLQFDLFMNENLYGTYPVQVSLWNAENATEICCFNFRIKSWSPNNL